MVDSTLIVWKDLGSSPMYAFCVLFEGERAKVKLEWGAAKGLEKQY